MADGKIEQDAKWAQQHWVSNISSEIPIFQGFLALLLPAKERNPCMVRAYMPKSVPIHLTID